VFVLSTNRKGAIAEAKITAAAVELDVPVLRPVAEHGRYDLAFEIGGRIHRIQCKWGSFDPQDGVIKVNLESSFLTPSGYVRTPYSAGEIDFFAVYCGQLDRCYLLPIGFVDGRRAIYLRLSPSRNRQRACINLAKRFEFAGAVAQLEERLNGIQEAGGSSPPSSISTPPERAVVETRAHQFRNHFGYYMERAAAGDEIHITRHGRPFARLMPPASLLESAA
jgi:prevent-host-death family protein